MKKIIGLVLVLMTVTTVSFADNSTPPPNQNNSKSGQPGPNFAAHKQKILDQIAHRIQRLQAIQSCIQNAQDHRAIKACREQPGSNPGGQQ